MNRLFVVVLCRLIPALALTVGERSETENLRPVLGRLGEFSDLFLARSEASLWSPTFSDLFWPTSEPSIATHSTGPGIRRRSRYPGTLHNHKKQKLFTFFFPDFAVRIAGYYFFEYRSLRARLQSRGHAPFRNAHNRTHNMFISDGTQDRLDRLNSSHSERDFSMANNPSPVLGRSPRQRRGQRSAVFSFYGKPEFVEEISQKTKRRTVSGPGESLRANGFIYKLQPRCRYKCLLPNCGVSRIQDGRGTSR